MKHNRQLWCWLPRPGRPAFRKWRQHANMERSHTTLCPSNARIGYSRYGKSSCGAHSLVLIIQWSSIIVAAIWFLSGDALLHDFSTSTSFVFTHRQFSLKGCCSSLAQRRLLLWRLCQWSLIAKPTGLTMIMNICGHGCSICWTHCHIDVCQFCCWMRMVGQVLLAVRP